ncbi:hypothetical protein CEQ90_18600 [Lewinellaceae bacterium SD302]|nr:hypothetical protein CEQ90_18600 [Lewinellaceae bacterium SD302]
MFFIGDVLVSDEIASEQFACNLNACKGACCWEGEYGAPLEKEELPIFADIYEQVAPYLTPAGKAAIEEQGFYTHTPDNDGYATALIDNGACAFMTRSKEGVALCGIEQAWRDGKIDWPKPISCHLYPIRVKSKKEGGFEALNYDRWDICSAACAKGAENKIHVYEFAKTALVRKYGEEWYEELSAAVDYAKE